MSSAKSPRTHLVGNVIRAGLIFRCPESELLPPPRGAEPSSAQAQKPLDPPGDDSKLAEIAKPAKTLCAALGNQAPGYDAPDPQNAYRLAEAIIVSIAVSNDSGNPDPDL